MSQSFAPLPGFDAEHTNLAYFVLDPRFALVGVTHGVASIVSIDTEGDFLVFGLRYPRAAAPAPSLCYLWARPAEMVASLLPPGNAVRECIVTGDGLLHFVFSGIDAPLPVQGEMPRMALAIGQTPAGLVTWFEPTREPVPAAPDDPLLLRLQALVAADAEQRKAGGAAA